MRTRIPLWLKLSALLLVVVLGVTAFSAIRKGRLQRANQPWESYRRELAAAGEPLTLTEIEAQRPVIPPGSNGALVVEQLSEELEGLSVDPPEWLPFFHDELRRIDPFVGLPQPAVAPMRACIEKHRSTIDALSKLRHLTDGRLTIISYDIPGDNPLEFRLPSLRPWINAGKLQHLLALSHLIDGDTEHAVEAAIIQFNVAATLRNEPNTIVRQVRLVILRRAVATIECVLRAGELEQQRLVDLEGLIDAQLDSLSPASALQSERAWIIKLFDGLASGKLELSKVYGESALAPLGPVSLADIREAQIAVTDMWTRLISAADNYVASIAIAERIDKGESSRSISPLQKLLAEQFMPDAASVRNSARGIAELRCAHAALAAERYRLVNDRLPQSFAQLIPDFINSTPIDPLNGQPLSFLTTDYGIAIYSVGNNMADDGGNFTIPNGQSRPLDCGFRLAERAKRGTIVAAP